MKIEIAQRLKPFSHRPGIASPLLGTNLFVKAFPTRIELIAPQEKLCLGIELKGPVVDFTVQLDLEKDGLFIFGTAKEGYFRLFLKAEEKGVRLFVEKSFQEGILIDQKRLFSKQHLFYPLSFSFFLPKKWEKLSLGGHKKQEIDLLQKKGELKELIPLLYGLSQKIPSLKGEKIGSATLLGLDLSSFCKAAFFDLLSPRLFDDQYQGLCPLEGKDEDPFFLFSELNRWIRSLFFIEKEEGIDLLPTDLFDAGRMVGIQAFSVGTIDLEWSSFRLRRVMIDSLAKKPFFLKTLFPFTSFRLTEIGSLEKKRHLMKEPLFLKEGKRYLLDQFHEDRNCTNG